MGGRGGGLILKIASRPFGRYRANATLLLAGVAGSTLVTRKFTGQCNSLLGGRNRDMKSPPQTS